MVEHTESFPFGALINGKVHLFVFRLNQNRMSFPTHTHTHKMLLADFCWIWLTVWLIQLSSLLDGYHISSSLFFQHRKKKPFPYWKLEAIFPRLFIGHFVANLLNNGDSHGNAQWSALFRSEMCVCVYVENRTIQMV